MVLALMEGGAEEITQAVVAAAKKGDLAAARLVIERLAPPLRERPLCLPLPDTRTVAGVSEAQQAILEAVGGGEILPGEGTALAGILEARRKALETVELEQRISALEARHGQRGRKGGSAGTGGRNRRLRRPPVPEVHAGRRAVRGCGGGKEALRWPQPRVQLRRAAAAA
jgi:hypothetical protein